MTLHCKLVPVKYREYEYGVFNYRYLYYRCFFVFVEREKFDAIEACFDTLR